ncbi:MAG: hypothetical protein KIS92_21865 [Planctomycetota bacterium]|nr:hypothetical protein [Planctomycetota bacterium]
MPRGRKPNAIGKTRGAANGGGDGKRGRKPIFTDEQKRVLDRLIRGALKDQLRSLVKSL